MIELAKGVFAAKRLNNNKRAYVLVQELQAKHMPAIPSRAIDYMKELGGRLKTKCSEKNTVVIGFAETATALSIIVANEIGADCSIIHTTRELEQAYDSYIEFSEDHSHATEQYIHVNMLDNEMTDIECVVIVDDEITSGSTAMQLINLLRHRYQSMSNIEFIIASLLNCMDEDAKKQFIHDGIQMEYVSTIASCDCNAKFDMIKENTILDFYSNDKSNTLEFIEIAGRTNIRFGNKAKFYSEACGAMVDKIVYLCEVAIYESERILVLGTEEFMYPAIMLGAQIEDRFPNACVKTHSTTRSPIVPAEHLHYPIWGGCRVNSVYDPGRTTYLYNITRYDLVLIVTDSEGNLHFGVNSMGQALKAYGNDRIVVCSWRSV
jgi:adenine/guanine phosphoribosyltransferase-like PRPP-binding protein